MGFEAPQARNKVFAGIPLLNYRGRGSRLYGLVNFQQDHDHWHAYIDGPASLGTPTLPPPHGYGSV